MTYPVSSRKKGLALTAKEGLSFAEVSMRFGLSKSSEIRNIHEGLPIKKPHYHPKAKPEKRRIFSQAIAKVQKAEKPILYIDESGFAHDMPRTRDDAMKGQRCYAQHDEGAKGRKNALGALIKST